MASECPSCGRKLEQGQTRCACGWPDEKAVSGKSFVFVLVIGFLVVAIILAGLGAAGYVAWRLLNKPPTVAVQPSLPAPPTAPPMAPPPVREPTLPASQTSSMGANTTASNVVTPLPASQPSAPAMSEQDRFIASLRDPSRQTRQLAAEALQTRGWMPATDEQRALLLVALGDAQGAAKYEQAATDALCLPLLDGGDYELSQACAEILGRLLDPRAVDPLEKALLNSNIIDVRRTAANALGRIHDPRCVPTLKTALRHETDDFARGRISAALEKLNDMSDSDPLVAALKDDDSATQLRAAILLNRRGDSRGLDWMNQTINGEDPELRGQVIHLLRDINTPETVKMLVTRVDGRGYDGPTEAVDALVSLGEPSIPPMVAALHDMSANGRWQMMIGLARLGPKAMHTVTAMLPDAPKDLKKTICQVLGGIGERSDVPAKPFEPLVALLSDPDESIRRMAASSLENLKWQPATDDQRRQYEEAGGRLSKKGTGENQ